MPLVVARLLFVPAIATMNVPFCGSWIATTGSAPKRLVGMMLLFSTLAASIVQLNSALLYPSAGKLFNLTLTDADPPILMLAGLTSVETNGFEDTAVLVGEGGTLVGAAGVFVGEED